MYRERKIILLMSSIYLGSAIYLYSILITDGSLNKPFVHSKDNNLKCDVFHKSQYYEVPKK